MIPATYQGIPGKISRTYLVDGELVHLFVPDSGLTPFEVLNRDVVGSLPSETAMYKVLKLWDSKKRKSSHVGDRPSVTFLSLEGRLPDVTLVYEIRPTEDDLKHVRRKLEKALRQQGLEAPAKKTASGRVTLSSFTSRS